MLVVSHGADQGQAHAGHVLGVLLRLGGEADHLVRPVHGALHLAHALIPVQTSSRSCLSNSGDTESGFWVGIILIQLSRDKSENKMGELSSD